MTFKKTLYFFFIFLVQLSFAQQNKIDYYISNNDYNNAIKLLKTDTAKSIDACLQLADCYFYLEEYIQANNVYKYYYNKSTNPKPESYLSYSKTLNKLNNFNSAKQQLSFYEKANTNFANNEDYKKTLLHTNNVLYWNGLPEKYKIANLKELNTVYNEFSLSNYNNGYVFTSDRLTNITNDDYNKELFTAVFFSSLKPSNNDQIKIKETKLFNKKITSDYNIGPVCFNNNATEIYFNKSDGRSTKKQKATNKLFTGKINYDNITDIIAFDFNNDAYSILHPSINLDNNTLYFASDAPGGFGGYDLYFSKKINGKWSKPKNLGSHINTFKNELFPHISTNNILYFASNGLNGFGGLDIFESKVNNDSIFEPNNLYFPINSAFDDFSFYTNNTDSIGYFASNRKEGLGGDDIYTFKVDNTINDKNGKLALINENIYDGQNNIELYLLAPNGDVLQKTTTKNNGNFIFNNVKDGSYYAIAFKNNSIYNETPSQNIVILTDSNIIERIAERNDFGLLFRYNDLDNILKKQIEQNAISTSYLNNKKIRGVVYRGTDTTKVIQDLKISLYDKENNLIQTRNTQADGSFEFNNLSTNKDYIIEVDLEDEQVKNEKIILIKSSNTNETFAIIDRTKNELKFNLLASEKSYFDAIEDEIETQLLSNIKGNFINAKTNTPIKNATMKLLSNEGEILQIVKTNYDGSFRFNSIDASNSFYIITDVKDSVLKFITKAYVKNQFGEVIYELNKLPSGVFRFSFLPYDRQRISLLEEKDSKLNVTLPGKITTGSGASISNLKVFLFNANGEIVQTTKTNPKGQYKFVGINPNEIYFIKIDTTNEKMKNEKIIRLTDLNNNVVYESNTGNFNFKYLPSDNTKFNTLSETDNSSLIVKIKGSLKDIANNPLVNTSINLLDKNQAILSNTKTNDKGEFEFIPKDRNATYKIEFDKLDNSYASLKEIVLFDIAGKKVLRANKNNFTYQILSTDRNSMAVYDETDLSKFISKIKGSLKNTVGKPLINISLNIIDKNGVLIANIKTNENGDFEYAPKDKKAIYKIELDKLDKNYSTIKDVVLFDKNGEKILISSKETFVFNILSTDRSSMAIYDETDYSSLTIKTTKVTGKILDLNDQPIAGGTKVYLKDEKGKLIAEANLDANGNFIFDKIPSNKNYYVEVANVNETQLKIYNGFKLVDNSNNISKNGYYDAKGCFVFSLLSSDKTYFTKINDEQDVLLKIVKSKEQLEKERKETQLLKDVAANININNIKKLNVLLKAEFADSVYFKTNEYLLSDINKEVLNNLIADAIKINASRIQISTYADERASDQYNIILTQKRLKSVIAYLSIKGISDKIIVGYAKGEVKSNAEKPDLILDSEYYKLSRKAVIRIVK